MIVTGIIVEYNPFHNGHLKHIKLARQKTNCDVLVAVMSGNFVQRGEPAIFDKWTRTKTALANEVDLIIELPFPYVNQNASVFAQAAVDILNMAKCDYIVFGSELNDLETLNDYANININVDYLKEIMSDGTSYPKAYSLLSREFYPNDILAIAYLKALKNYKIKPIIIKRDNNNLPLNKKLEIESATNIRAKIKENKNVNTLSPIFNFAKIENALFADTLFPLYKTFLLSQNPSYLKTIALFAEGIENNLIKQASLHYTYQDFIQNSISKRYTKARIQRTLIAMACNLKQEELDNLPQMTQLKILGFNAIGQNYIKKLTQEKINVVTKFNQYTKVYRKIEIKSTAVYIAFLNSEMQEYLWNREFRGPIIYREKKFYNK